MSEAEDIGKIIEEVSPFYKKKGKPSREHKIVYDSAGETLEPLYFWILDFMTPVAGAPEKLIDNFTSSPGSGHFSELMGKATRMQEEGMKIMQTIGVLVKSLVNLIYDLREFEIRLSHYRDLKSKDKDKKQGALLALKQIWMDNVDMKRGVGSINQLAQQLNFVTLRDAFMSADSLERVKSMDVNDRVKRILLARVKEFFDWMKISEKELTKRFSIEKNYLKSQVNSLKLYTRWAKPYFKAASKLEQQDSKNPSLVTAFNTMILEIALMGKKAVKIDDAVVDQDLPPGFKGKKLDRDYYSCVLVDFYFRGIPQKAGQHYTFGGRSEVIFRAYALNAEEYELMKKKLGESDINDAIKLAEETTGVAIESLQEDIAYFLKEEKEEEEKSESKDVNPFGALLGIGEKKEKKEEKKEDKKEITEVKKDNYFEKTIRKLAEEKARQNCHTVYDVFKKAHRMASYPGSDLDFSKEEEAD